MAKKDLKQTEDVPTTTSDMGQDLAKAADAAGETKQSRAPASNFLPIVSGRLPQLFVHQIRFNETETTATIAKKFGTSVGKVFDIKKGRNFGYIHDSWMPTQGDIDAATAWVSALETPNKHGLKPEGNAEHLKTVIESYKARGLASAEQVAAQDALRARSRPAKAESTKPQQTAEVPQAAAADLLG